MSDTFTVEYSDYHMDNTSITMSVTGDTLLNGDACTIHSKHNRTFTSPLSVILNDNVTEINQTCVSYGPFVPQTGAWWQCKTSNGGNGWPTKSGIHEFIKQIPSIGTDSGYPLITSNSTDVSVKGGFIPHDPNPPPITPVPPGPPGPPGASSSTSDSDTVDISSSAIAGILIAALIFGYFQAWFFHKVCCKRPNDEEQQNEYEEVVDVRRKESTNKNADSKANRARKRKSKR